MRAEASTTHSARNATAATELAASVDQVAATAGELAQVSERLAATVRTFRL